jgi:hypothetical protein
MVITQLELLRSGLHEECLDNRHEDFQAHTKSNHRLVVHSSFPTLSVACLTSGMKGDPQYETAERQTLL